MNRIYLNEPITFRHASLRFFEPNEHHITRHCAHDVLVLVYEGILRFREAGIDYAIHAGEYYIQKAGLYQEGIAPSSSPKYLYVHFLANWTEADGLDQSGTFHYPQLKPLIDRLDKLSHSGAPYVEKAGCFYELLSTLYRQQHPNTLARQMAQYVQENYVNLSGLNDLCLAFHYSKNHIINLFRNEYGMTPVEYLNQVKLQRAMYLLEVTSDPAELVSVKSGFPTYSHFYRQFLRKTGQTPTQWRKAISLSPASFID